MSPIADQARGVFHPLHAFLLATTVAPFLGAALCATSVGITARVLKDLNREKTREARIILGAAVIDDVMGLVILAVVTGAIASADKGGALALGAVALIVVKALVFLVGSLAIGEASVVIAASAPHRAEAFAATRYVIEEIKKRLPVWKHERYVTGATAWLAGETGAANAG